MKRLPLAVSLLATLLALLGPLASASYADTARISATLIRGSNAGAGADASLARYERHLSRVFPFDSFQRQGAGETAVELPGTGQIAVGQQHLVSLDVAEADNGKLRIAARWSSGGRTLINTTVVTPRNQPTVLGGPSSNGGKLILLLEAR